MCGDTSPVSDALEYINTVNNCVNQNKSGKYRNDENLIKFGMNASLEAFSRFLEPVKKELEKI